MENLSTIETLESLPRIIWIDKKPYGWSLSVSTVGFRLEYIEAGTTNVGVTVTGDTPLDCVKSMLTWLNNRMKSNYGN